MAKDNRFFNWEANPTHIIHYPKLTTVLAGIYSTNYVGYETYLDTIRQEPETQHYTTYKLC